MLDFTRLIGPGAGVWWSHGAAEPTSLIHALLDQVGAIGPIRAFIGLSWDERVTRGLPEEVRAVSFGAMGHAKALSRAGRLEIIPTHYSALPRLFAERRLPSDLGLVQVGPPDELGQCSLGPVVDYVDVALQSTPLLLAEVNLRVPTVPGSPRIELSRFNSYIETDRPLRSLPPALPTPVEQRIGEHVASLVEDGDTIQVGIGRVPSAAIAALHDHRALGFHSGVLTDAVLDLADRGVITGAHKEIDRGIMVAGMALGTSALYERLARPDLKLRSVTYVHAPETLARFHRLTSINTAVEVDLTGQVNAETRDGSYVGGIGGHADFSRAAASTGARSIVALPSTDRGRSTITPQLSCGSVTTTRADVCFVVTEHGVAELSGASFEQRARRLIAIAAPQFREDLSRSFAQWLRGR